MVHALSEVWRALKTDGRLIDLRPTMRNRSVELVLGGAAYVAEFTAVGKVVSSPMSVLITTAHVAIGALMLVVSIVVTVIVYRLTSLSTTS